MCTKLYIFFMRSEPGCVSSVEMALLRYFKTTNGLPDPKGSFSTISPDIIAEMNKEVKEASRCIAGGKRGTYKMYSSSKRSQIGKYVSSPPCGKSDEYLRLPVVLKQLCTCHDF